MTKYTVASRRSAKTEVKQVDPIWRGIGCIMIIVIPLMAYGIATIVMGIAVDKNWPIPYQLMGYPTMPKEMFLLPGLVPVAVWLQGQQNLYGIVMLTVLFTIALGALLSMVYAFAYKAFGPPLHGPLDVEQPRVTVKKYKR
ncbi:MAG: hypothetical protein ACM3MF_02315 [Anaerolineae bacterium]